VPSRRTTRRPEPWCASQTTSISTRGQFMTHHPGRRPAAHSTGSPRVRNPGNSGDLRRRSLRWSPAPRTRPRTCFRRSPAGTAHPWVAGAPSFSARGTRSALEHSPSTTPAQESWSTIGSSRCDLVTARLAPVTPGLGQACCQQPNTTQRLVFSARPTGQQHVSTDLMSDPRLGVH
jgi:hypothetical protein